MKAFNEFVLLKSKREWDEWYRATYCESGGKSPKGFPMFARAMWDHRDYPDPIYLPRRSIEGMVRACEKV